MSEYKDLSGAEKICLQIATILLFAGVLMFLFFLSSLSSYDVNVKQENYSNSNGNKVAVAIGVKDKLTKGTFVSSYEAEYFNIKSKPNVSYRKVGDYIDYKGEDPLLTEENLQTLQKLAIDRYKQNAQIQLGIVAVLTAAVWFIRKWMKKKFYSE